MGVEKIEVSRGDMPLDFQQTRHGGMVEDLGEIPLPLQPPLESLTFGKELRHDTSRGLLDDKSPILCNHF